MAVQAMTASLASDLFAQIVTSPAERASMSGLDKARRLIDKGRQLRSAGDRAGSLAAFRQATEADPSNTTATIECGYDHLHLVQIAEASAAFERSHRAWPYLSPPQAA
jgi:hypothetical protein